MTYDKRPRGKAGNRVRVYYYKDLKPGQAIESADGRTKHIIQNDGSRRRYIPPPAPVAPAREAPTAPLTGEAPVTPVNPAATAETHEGGPFCHFCGEYHDERTCPTRLSELAEVKSGRG
jgi:hypothetical protein